MIKTLSLKNWKSHEDTELNFTDETNVIVGDMGSGKTSAVEAISYGLFGTYPSLRSRETTLDETIMNVPIEKNKAEVKVTFTANGDKYTVKRTIEKGKGTTESELRKQGKLIEGPSTKKVTETIEKILKMNYELFSKAIYAEQNRMNYFLEIPKGKRKEKIDELLEIDRWENARKNLTTAINMLKDRKKSLEKQTEDTEEIKKIPKLKEKTHELKKKLSKYKEKLEETKGKLKTKKKKHEKNKKKEKKDKKLRKQANKLKNQIEYLGKDLEELPKAKNPEKIKKNLKKKREQKKKLKEKLKKKNKLETKIETLKENLEEQKKKLQRKTKKIKEIKVTPKTKEKLQKAEENLDKTKNKIQEKKLKRQQAKEELKEKKQHLKQLEKKKAKCPVCGADLTGGKKEEITQERKEEIQKLEGKRNKLKKQKKELEKKRKTQEKKVKRLEKEKEKLQTKKKLKEDTEELEKDIEKKKKQRKKLKKKHKSIETKKTEEDIEKEIEELEEKKEYIEKAKQKKKKTKELEEKKNKRKELEYDEEKMKKLYEEIKNLEKEENVLKQRIKDRKELKEEKAKRLKDLEKKKKKIEETKKKAKYLEGQLGSLKTFKYSLKNLQGKLRQEFIQETNTALETVWKKIYPYRNYENLRLEVNEDGDYILKLQLRNGEWTDVEGTASGGERSTAGLCLRIALSLVLAGDLSWIILDEPTHNMDDKAIENLSTTLGNYLHKIIDQVFIITHEPGLKKASSGTYYKFVRDKEENEPTNVVREIEG